MATIVLQVPDESLVTKVKQACKMLMGVTSVKMQKPKEYDITKTAQNKATMDDVKHGRVTTYTSLKDFYKEMGLEESRRRPFCLALIESGNIVESEASYAEVESRKKEIRNKKRSRSSRT